MSLKGSEKEFLFSLYLKEQPYILENALGVKLKRDNVMLEKYYYGMKLDMYTTDLHTGNEIFVENLLLKSNDAYQKKILRILDSIQQGIVVYQALDFNQKHVKELENMMISSGKSIILFLMKVNPFAVNILERLNRLSKLEVYRNLSMLNKVQNPIQMVSRYGNVKSERIERPWVIRKQNYDLKRREDINQFLLHELRRSIPYFLSFQREKTNLEKIRILQFGAGLSGTGYFVSLENRRKLAFIELRFSYENSYLYQIYKDNEHIVKQKIGRDIQFDDNIYAIGVYFKPSVDVKDTINQIVVEFKKMIDYFSNYLFKLKRFEEAIAVS